MNNKNYVLYLLWSIMVLIGADLRTETITSETGDVILEAPSIEIGKANFPSGSGGSRSIASFGGSTPSFIPTASRQLVESASATIQEGITIVGVNFDGPVVLTLADGETNLDEIFIVDEGGFCSPQNPISIQTSTGDPGGSFMVPLLL